MEELQWEATTAPCPRNAAFLVHATFANARRVCSLFLSNLSFPVSMAMKMFWPNVTDSKFPFAVRCKLSFRRPEWVGCRSQRNSSCQAIVVKCPTIDVVAAFNLDSSAHTRRLLRCDFSASEDHSSYSSRYIKTLGSAKGCAISFFLLEMRMPYHEPTYRKVMSKV